MTDNECCLGKEPFPYMCCCICKHHLPVNHHCSTNRELKKARGGACICDERKGWACVPPELGPVVFDNWGEHGIGCEMFEELVK